MCIRDRSVSALVTALWIEGLSDYWHRKTAISTKFSQLRSTVTGSYSNFGLTRVVAATMSSGSRHCGNDVVVAGASCRSRSRCSGAGSNPASGRNRTAAWHAASRAAQSVRPSAQSVPRDEIPVSPPGSRRSTGYRRSMPQISAGSASPRRSSGSPPARSSRSRKSSESPRACA